MTTFEPPPVDTPYQLPKAFPNPDQSKNWYRRISPMLFAHKWWLFTGLAGAMIALFINVAIPRITMQAIDEALVFKREPLMFYVWLLIGLGIVRSIVVYSYRYLLFRTAFMVEFDMRTMMFNHISWLSFSFFDRVQTGQLISRSNSDIRAVQMFLVFSPFMLINIFTFSLALGFMLTVHVGLSVVSLLPLPLVYFTAVKMRQRMYPVSWLVQSRLADIATIVEENVTGAHIVKSFAAELNQIRHAALASERLRWASVHQLDVRAIFGPIMENMPRLATASVILYGGYLAIIGEVTVGTLVAFSAYVLMLQGPFRLLGMLMMMSQRSAASAQRIFEILDTQPEIVDAPNAKHLTESQGAVAFESVQFEYNEGLAILKDLSFKIHPGETLAVVGRTGCGKTTMARLLTRFYDVNSGSIKIDGSDIRQLSQTSLRSSVGVVPDEPILFSITIQENIAYGRPDASFDEIVAAAKAAEAHEFIENLSEGYETMVGERGYTLSGGQRQRIAIARTLLTNPRILILDDATSSVDVAVEQKIHLALRSFLKGRSTLIIAHRLSTISLADRVLFLEDGQVAAQGTHEELMVSEPRYVEVLAKAEAEKEKRLRDKETTAGPSKPEDNAKEVPGLEQRFKEIN